MCLLLYCCRSGSLYQFMYKNIFFLLENMYWDWILWRDDEECYQYVSIHKIINWNKIFPTMTKIRKISLNLISIFVCLWGLFLSLFLRLYFVIILPFLSAFYMTINIVGYFSVHKSFLKLVSKRANNNAPCSSCNEKLAI
jgi:hypothetical protein